ncbi:MAG TPA: hypothetical protein VK797_24040 [Tepidisphaeraceae bacterium]|jgi:hypothetical protein|nr:hypothetical protein [Tepidisphaeraceae bacterium]
MLLRSNCPIRLSWAHAQFVQDEAQFRKQLADQGILGHQRWLDTEDDGDRGDKAAARDQ